MTNNQKYLLKGKVRKLLRNSKTSVFTKYFQKKNLAWMISLCMEV